MKSETMLVTTLQEEKGSVVSGDYDPNIEINNVL